MKKAFVLSYSLLCYAIGLCTVAYYADFFVGLFVPKTINSDESSTLGAALAINFLLLLVFSIPHSVMARPSVKQWMRNFIPFAIERSTYILVSSITVLLLCVFWQPIPMPIFDFRDTLSEAFMWSLYALGWCVTLFSTFLIDHFDLFGLKQALYYGNKGKNFAYKLATPLLYKIVRHPIYLGWFMVHWFTPYLSIGQFQLAFCFTVYTLIAIEYEETDLINTFGEAYIRYKEQTPKLFPIFFRK